MFDSLAVLISEVHSELGSPAIEILHPKHVAQAAWKTFAYYGLTQQQSAEGRVMSQRPISPASRDVDLTQTPDMAIPSYIERKSANSAEDTWTWVPSASHSLIEESRSRGDLRCAFYKSDSGRWRLALSYDPLGYSHKLWFYKDPVVPSALGDPLPLPSRFAPMFVARTIINTVPPMLMRASSLPEESQLNAAQLQAISAVIAHANSELEIWEKLFRTENEADKSPRGRMRRPILSNGPFIRRTY